MSIERKKLLHSIIVPALFVAALWLIKFGEIIFSADLSFLGIYPLKVRGLPGILLSPLIHGDIRHLAANSLPLLLLGSGIFYFYREIAYRVIILLYIIPGIWVWFGAREAYHIGASGLIYGLASFLFFSGLLRRDGKLMALSLLIVFVYGSMVWGIFPNFIPQSNISWESHLMGLIAGIILAFYYRKLGPQRKKYDWELEEEEGDENREGDDDGDPGGYSVHYEYKE